MIAEPHIIIKIKPDGTATVDAKEYHGMGCKAATEAYERALGKTVSDTNKPEIAAVEIEEQQSVW